MNQRILQLHLIMSWTLWQYHWRSSISYWLSIRYRWHLINLWLKHPDIRVVIDNINPSSWIAIIVCTHVQISHAKLTYCLIDLSWLLPFNRWHAYLLLLSIQLKPLLWIPFYPFTIKAFVSFGMLKVGSLWNELNSQRWLHTFLLLLSCLIILI